MIGRVLIGPRRPASQRKKDNGNQKRQSQGPAPDICCGRDAPDRVHILHIGLATIWQSTATGGMSRRHVLRFRQMLTSAAIAPILGYTGLAVERPAGRQRRCSCVASGLHEAGRIKKDVPMNALPIAIAEVPRAGIAPRRRCSGCGATLASRFAGTGAATVSTSCGSPARPRSACRGSPIRRRSRRSCSIPPGGSPAATGSTMRCRSGQSAAAVVASQAAERAYRSSGGVARIDTRLEVGAGGAARMAAAGNHPLRAKRAPPPPRGRCRRLGDAARRRNGAARPRGDGRDPARHLLRRRLADPPRRRPGLCRRHAARRRCRGDDGRQGDRRRGRGVCHRHSRLARRGERASTPPAQLLAEGGCEAGASAWNGMLVARILAPGGQALRFCLTKLLEMLRDAAMPRVWNC